jgi:hypothetical protein
MRGGFKVFVSGAAVVAMTFAVASTANAQDPAAAPQEPKKPTFPLPQACQDCEVALVTVFIKNDKTADFEAVLNKVKEALGKSENAQRKEQAKGWTVFKSGAPGPKLKVGDAQVDTTAYIMRIEPIVKGADYDLMILISEVFPVEAQEIFTKYKDAFAGRAITEMKRFMPMQ